MFEVDWDRGRIGDRFEGTWKGGGSEEGLVRLVGVAGIGVGVRWGDSGDVWGDRRGVDSMAESYGAAAAQSSEVLLW